MKLQPNLWGSVQSKKPKSECQILIEKELPEDSSDDDEYQPHEPNKEYLEVKLKSSILFFLIYTNM